MSTTITSEKAIVVIEKRMAPLVERAIKIVITNSDEQRAAGNDLTQLNKYGDELKSLKEGLTKPMNAALKAARELFKPREEKLDIAIGALRDAMGTYQLETELKAAEEEAKIAARVGEGKGKLKAETAVRKMDEIDRPDQHIETDGGSVKFRDKRNFEVMDIALLPIAYHLPDESAIRVAMQQGVELPGVRYWISKVPINSR